MHYGISTEFKQIPCVDESTKLGIRNQFPGHTFTGEAWISLVYHAGSHACICTGLPIVLAKEEESVLLGGAILAACASGKENFQVLYWQTR